MAGEAGRGFAVVADEVQGLAERSAAATKQIASLVKTIQTDTNEAVSSMESTTTEVVKGADLAHNAGVALEEIENVSADLAELIQDISSAARQQAKTASHVSGTMNVIQEISSQTLSGTGATASSVGELAEMAVDMRESVSGFKLPETSNSADLYPETAVTDFESIDSEQVVEASDTGAVEPAFAEQADVQEVESGVSQELAPTEELVSMAEDIADTLSDSEQPADQTDNSDDEFDIAVDAEYLAAEGVVLDDAENEQDFIVELDGDFEDSDNNDNKSRF